MAAPVPAPKYIFITGAPDAASLNWETSDLTAGISLQLTRYLADAAPAREERSAVERDARDSLPAWRLLPLARQHLQTGLTPASPAGRDDVRWEDQELSFHIPKAGEEASFLTTSSLSSDGPQGQAGQGHTSLSQVGDDVLSQFYEHSFALHEADRSESPSVPSRTIGPEELPPEDSQIKAASSGFSGSSLDDDSSPLSTSSPQQQRTAAPVLPPAAKAALINDLDDIPSAAYLHSITPQTMTVNLIVGILDIKPPRLIKIRRGSGMEMEIVEILVGDETRSGFGISFWLWPERGRAASAAKNAGTKFQQRRNNESEGLRNILSKLRPQDIILARNVALSSFRGQVYGQLLRMDLARLYLLYRNPVRWDGDDDDGNEETLCIYHRSELMGRECASEHPQTRKVKRVRDWVLHFVAGPAHTILRREAPAKESGSKAGGWLAGNDSAMMPPDTPL
ncbi:MAG: hypothetical protein M1813_007813 [Trichoglossum hirsutum]|nr:MAG: hypothetical protein M1813_007813 [Trichoglossum hirsutum]